MKQLLAFILFFLVFSNTIYCNQDKNFDNSYLIQKFDLQNRKRTAKMMVINTYGLTVVGALAMGVNNMTCLFIPVIGPFLQWKVVADTDYAVKYKNRDRVLLLISGLLQSYFAYDHFLASKEEHVLLLKNLSIMPIGNNYYLKYTMRF